MLRVMIVDDEPIVRIALREIVDWEKYDCQVCGEASNGREALRKIEEDGIDLVVVDMQMPVMNGIEFIKVLRSHDPQQKIGVIVLSAYSNYEYVREAFLYGALDYIIKDDLNEEKVSAVIRKGAELVRGRMDEADKRERIGQAEQQQRREKWFFDLLQDKADLSPAASSVESAEREEWLGGIQNYRQLLSCIVIDRSYSSSFVTINESKANFVLHTVRQVIEEYGYQVFITPVTPMEYALLLLIPRHQRGLSVHRLLSEMMQKATKHIEQYIDVTAAIGTADPVGEWRSWPVQYREALYLAQLRFFYGTGHVFFAEDSYVFVNASQLAAVFRVPEWIRQIENGDTEWKLELKHSLRQMTLPRKETVERILQPFRSFLWELDALLHAQSSGWVQVPGACEFPLVQLEKFANIRELGDWFYDLVDAAAGHLNPVKRMVDSAPRMAEKVRQWIDTHYTEPISLSSASTMAGISENYLSKIFAREVGETFIQYVTRRRIERAIQLMKSGMKIYEISEKVGYPNQGHFTKVFKRVMGQSPAEYREQQI